MNRPPARFVGCPVASFAIGSSSWLGAAIVLAAPSPLPASRAPAGIIAADDQTLHSFALTLGLLAGMREVALRVIALERQHAELSRPPAHVPADGHDTLDATIRRLGSIAHVRDALCAAGVSARDYALTGMTFFPACLAAATRESYAKCDQHPPALPRNVNPAHVTFVLANRRAIDTLDLGAMARGETTPSAPATRERAVTRSGSTLRPHEDHPCHTPRAGDSLSPAFS